MRSYYEIEVKVSCMDNAMVAHVLSVYVTDNYAKDSTPSRLKRCGGNIPVTGLFTFKTFGSVVNKSVA